MRHSDLNLFWNGTKGKVSHSRRAVRCQRSAVPFAAARFLHIRIRFRFITRWYGCGRTEELLLLSACVYLDLDAYNQPHPASTLFFFPSIQVQMRLACLLRLNFEITPNISSSKWMNKCIKIKRGKKRGEKGCVHGTVVLCLHSHLYCLCTINLLQHSPLHFSHESINCSWLLSCNSSSSVR